MYLYGIDVAKNMMNALRITLNQMNLVVRHTFTHAGLSVHILQTKLGNVSIN